MPASTSSLLYNIGLEVDMDYSCSGSGANTGDAVNALTGAYNYSSASYTNYSHHTVKNEINAGYPVILRGRNSNSGHAWVCDGYRSSQYYECQRDPYGGSALVAVHTHTTLYLHMVWGWGTTSVGYYAFNGWDPTGTPGPYNDDKKMIVNIRP